MSGGCALEELVRHDFYLRAMRLLRLAVRLRAGEDPTIHRELVLPTPCVPERIQRLAEVRFRRPEIVSQISNPD